MEAPRDAKPQLQDLLFVLFSLNPLCTVSLFLYLRGSKEDADNNNNKKIRSNFTQLAPGAIRNEIQNSGCSSKQNRVSLYTPHGIQFSLPLHTYISKPFTPTRVQRHAKEMYSRFEQGVGGRGGGRGQRISHSNVSNRIKASISVDLTRSKTIMSSLQSVHNSMQVCNTQTPSSPSVQ